MKEDRIFWSNGRVQMKYINHLGPRRNNERKLNKISMIHKIWSNDLE